MSKIINSVFMKPRPPEIHGDFVLGNGYVKCQVEIGGGKWPFDVTFQIDTASYCTILLDTDFIYTCKALGWTEHRDPDILNWIRTSPHLFQSAGRANTIGGETCCIYRVATSCLRYYLPDGGVLDNKWQPNHKPIYGSFSRGFSQGTSGAHVSLLGIERLNELRQLLWSHPRNRIRLTP